ncbi:MAG: RNA-guided endonuclease InsQ/TnpB family protein [Candidatus Kariarchaeaceae archaeon]
MVTLTRAIQAFTEIHPKDRSILIQTMEEYRVAAQTASDYGYTHKTASAVKIHHQTYADLRKTTDLPSQLICASRNKSSEVLKSLKNKTKKSQPSFKYCLPIRYDQRSSTIFPDKSLVTLVSVSGRIRVHYQIPKYFQKYNNWERKGIELVYRNKLFLINFIVEKKIKDSRVHSGEVIGVDRGIKNIAVDSNNNFYNGKHVREVKRRYFRLRHTLQKKGTRSAKRKLQKTRERERRFQKDVNHCTSKKLVGRSQNNSTIVFEDLKDIRASMRGQKRMNREFHSWPFFQLEEFVRYKAKEKGIIFKEVDPRYTSQKCSRCHHVNRNNRKGSLFRCQNCGYTTDADRNAALNIKNDYIHNSIHLFLAMENPIIIHHRQKPAEGGISIFSGAQISSPIVAS